MTVKLPDEAPLSKVLSSALRVLALHSELGALLSSIDPDVISALGRIRGHTMTCDSVSFCEHVQRYNVFGVKFKTLSDVAEVSLPAIVEASNQMIQDIQKLHAMLKIYDRIREEIDREVAINRET